MEIDTDIFLYVITGVYGFLIIFLFAFVIHLYQKVQNLSKDDDDDDDRSDIRSAPRQPQQPQRQEPDFTIPKPMISKERQHNNDVPERNFNQRDTPDRNFGHRDSPDRNFGQSKDFGAIDFNNRMKPPSAQGGSYKNPLFDQGPRDLENKYFAGPRDNHRTKPQPPAFKPPSSGFNQPNSLYPRNDFQNNNYRY